MPLDLFRDRPSVDILSVKKVEWLPPNMLAGVQEHGRWRDFQTIRTQD